MTCKDCYHYEVCSIKGKMHTSKEYTNGKAVTTDFRNDVEYFCKRFKNIPKIIELPCKVGDKIYILNRNKTKVQEMVLDKPDIRCHCNEEHNLCMALCFDVKNGICAYRFNNDFREIGKTVFLTREEAEAKLKELNKQ